MTVGPEVVDALTVHKDADGDITVMHLSNLTDDEAVEFGSKVGALIGLGMRTPGMCWRRFRTARPRALDLVGIGLVSADEARNLHALELASAGRS